jgi:hypothetical protein
MERSLQALIWRRAGDRCEYCQVPQDRDRLPVEFDHIIAENHGGRASTQIYVYAASRAIGMKPSIDYLDQTIINYLDHSHDCFPCVRRA